MNRLSALLKKDIILGVKDLFLILEVVFAVIMVLALLFVIPEDVRTEGHVYILDETDIIRNFIEKHVPDAEKRMGEYYVDTREEVIAGMTEDTNAVGLLVAASGDGTYDIELLTQPYTKDGTIDFIDIDLEDLFSILHPPYGTYPADVYDSVRIEAFKRGFDEILPFNKMLLPTFLVFNVGLIGLFALVSIIGQERTDMTIRAFRLTPTSLNLFIVSKHILMILLGFVTFTIIYLPMMGFQGYFLSLLIMLVTVVTMSSVGIMLASYYKGPMEAMGWVFIIMMLLALPVVSQLNPIFNPWWLKIIPTYHTLFAIEEAMFPSGNSQIIWGGLLVLTAVMVVFVLYSGWLFSRKLKKEA